jgi:hypothetical protein
MAYQIRPLSLAEILDRSLRLLMDNALILIAISAVIWVPYRLFVSFGPILAGIGMLALLAAAPLMQAAITCAVAEIYLDRPVSFGGAYRSAWNIFFPFLGTYLLLYLFLILISLPALIVGGLDFAGWLTIPGLFGLVVLGTAVAISFFTVRWSLIGPIMIAERRFAGAALRRSGALTSGAWWRTFGVTLVAGLLVQVPIGILNLLWSSIPLLGTLLSAFTFSIASAYSVIMIVVYYFDRRCRVEDFDLHLLAEQIRGADTSVAGAPSIG